MYCNSDSLNSKPKDLGWSWNLGEDEQSGRQRVQFQSAANTRRKFYSSLGVDRACKQQPKTSTYLLTSSTAQQKRQKGKQADRQTYVHMYVVVYANIA